MAQSLKRKGKGIVKTGSPKADELEGKKDIFIEYLRRNGIVSEALGASGLARRTAYRHFRNDVEFADRWQEALEVSHDNLFAEARRRALEGDIRFCKDEKGQTVEYRKKSDRLLIFLLKISDARLKWRGRIVQTGNLAVNAVRSAGKEAALSEEQIRYIQDFMVNEFKKVSLV